MFFQTLKMACTEFSSDNNFYIKNVKLIVFFLNLEDRQVFLPHPVQYYSTKPKSVLVCSV
jgi:hypothetical protein